MATRSEIKRQIALLLGETWDTDAGNEPFWLDQLVDQATNNLCRATDCYWASATYNINGSPTAEEYITLTSTAPYRIKRIEVLDSAGNAHALTGEGEIVTQSWADSWMPSWRTSPSSGTPRVAIIARPRLYLYPRPDYDSTGGVTLYGFGLPAAWASNSSTFPLEDRCIAAVVYEAAYLRCIQFPTQQNQLRLGLLDRERKHLFGDIEAEVAIEYDRSRYGSINL